jgi:uncharacterized protein (TIGR03435 family)
MKVLLTILAITSACTLLGQTTSAVRFEVASIKPNSEGGADTAGNGIVRALPGGRLTAQKALLRYIIQTAYQVRPFQIVGGPDWIGSAHYDIEAKAEEDVPAQQLPLMLQSLLADRFKLQIRREIREMPVYDLLPAKSGVKLPAPKDGGCLEPNPNGPPMPPPTGAAGLPTPLCGTVMGAGGPNGMHLIGGRASIADLTRILTNMLGRTVVDKTGYTGKFDVNIEFSFDQALAGMPLPLGTSLVTDSTNPSIFTALQERLGLRLDSAKGPVEVIVIEHIEKPAEN